MIRRRASRGSSGELTQGGAAQGQLAAARHRQGCLGQPFHDELLISQGRAQRLAGLLQADQAHQQNAELQRQLNGLNAKQTDRGLVMTLGDLLFSTGRSGLRAGTVNNLDKLALFLKQHEDRDVLIEGHTDTVGSEEANLFLSQSRADSMMSFLQQQGVASIRLGSSGKGESSPVASNDSASGWQMNRRVEVIIRTTSNAQD